jgi:uncharacterized membrane protein HdeD (DUF308 family)
MKTAALVIGFILLAMGIACFVPGASADGMLFGMFPFTMPLAIAFVVTGAIGIMIGLSRRRELPPVTGEGNDLRNL